MEVSLYSPIQLTSERTLADSSNPEMPPVPPAEAFEPASNLNEDDHDDLPF